MLIKTKWMVGLQNILIRNHFEYHYSAGSKAEANRIAWDYFRKQRSTVRLTRKTAFLNNREEVVKENKSLFSRHTIRNKPSEINQASNMPISGGVSM